MVTPITININKQKQNKMKFFKKKKQQPELLPSNPYVLEIKNTTDEVKEWVLFGANRYLNQPNNGNPVGVEISNLQNDNGYDALFQEVSNLDISIGYIRFISGNPTNLNQEISHHYHTSAGGLGHISYVRRDLYLGLMRDAYQQQSDIVEQRGFPEGLKINSQTHFSGTIEPNSKLTISIFPSKIGNNEFERTHLSGANVSPVIIMTSKSGNPRLFGCIVNFFKFKWLLKKNQK